MLTPANYWVAFDSLAQHHAITHEPDPAIHLGAATRIIDAVAVADIEATLAAVPPDRVLNEAREGLRKQRIELPGIDPLGHGLNDVGAAAGPVATGAIQVVRVKPSENAGPVQKVFTVGRAGMPVLRRNRNDCSGSIARITAPQHCCLLYPS